MVLYRKNENWSSFTVEGSSASKMNKKIREKAEKILNSEGYKTLEIIDVQFSIKSKSNNDWNDEFHALVFYSYTVEDNKIEIKER